MPKRQTNNLRWVAELMKISNGVDDDDRPTTIRSKVRNLMYEPLGITSNEKYLAMQAKTDIDYRIKCRWDKQINEKDYGVRIDSIDFNIVRIYVLLEQREMEMSLSRVD